MNTQLNIVKTKLQELYKDVEAHSKLNDNYEYYKNNISPIKEQMNHLKFHYSNIKNIKRHKTKIYFTMYNIDFQINQYGDVILNYWSIFKHVFNPFLNFKYY